MGTLIIITGKSLKEISSYNRRLVQLLGTLRTSVIDTYLGYVIYDGVLTEKEKSELIVEFEDAIIFFISFETENIDTSIIKRKLINGILTI